MFLLYFTYLGAKEEAGQQQYCPASALACPPAHLSRYPPLSAPLSSRLYPLAACPSASAVPMFPTSPPSYLLLSPPPSHLPPDPSRIAVAARIVPSCPILLSPALSVAVVRDKRDDKSEKKKRGE